MIYTIQKMRFVGLYEDLVVIGAMPVFLTSTLQSVGMNSTKFDMTERALLG